ncbi:MAG TPA: tetratricopeptide repeat protein [Methylocystis sp.]
MGLLSAFNPHEFSESRVRTVATGRTEDLKNILATIRGNLTAATIQHLIVSAPRGYGKSFMMRHIQIEVERIAREENLAVVTLLMPEEMPHVREPETLIRELTRALTGGAGEDAELTWHEDEGAAWDAAVEALEAAIHQKLGARGLVVAQVENFDLLLRRAFAKEVQASRLRALLTKPGGQLMMIAASASGAFDRSYDDRLFQAFREVELEPWTVEDCLDFFDRQRKDAGKPPLDEFTRARAKAVASFIGGTPRLATLLGDALFDADMLRAADLLQKLVDELTPYYKERIEALPGRAQKLLDALLRGGEPATQSELTRRVKADTQAAIAGPFNDLVKERIVVGEKAPGSAQVLYRVADRVFAHYYRRRVIDHGKTACPLEALVDLLAEFFSRDEKQEKAAEYARLGRIAEARVMARLYEADGGEGKRGRRWMLRDLARYYIPKRLIPLASEAIAGRLHAIADLAGEGEVDAAYAEIETTLSVAVTGEDRVPLLLTRSSLDAYENIEGGLAAARAAVAAAERLEDKRFEIEAKVSRIWSLRRCDRFSEALDLSRHLVEQAGLIDIDRARALKQAANCLGDLGRHEEAVGTLRKAAEFARAANELFDEAVILQQVAYSLAQLGRHEEAVETARQSADIARTAGDKGEEAAALRYAAYCMGMLGRHEEAVATARQAADLAWTAGDNDEEASALGVVSESLAKLGRYKEGGVTARQAVDLTKTTGTKEERAGALRLLALNLSGLGELEAALRALAASAEISNVGEGEEEIEFHVNTAEWIAFRASESLFAGVVDLHPLHALLRVAVETLDFDGLLCACLDAWLRSFLGEALHYINDPDKLEAVATAVELHFPGRYGDEVSRLRGAAQYLTSGRDPAALARLDPDLATTLKLIHPPLEKAPAKEKAKPSKRRKTR